MGKEIVYCEICGDRILELEFEKGRAITVMNKNYCFNCKDEAVKNITMEDMADDEIEPEVLPLPRRPAPGRSGATRPIPRKGTGASRMRPAPGQFPQGAPQAHSKAPLLIGGGVGLGAMLVLIIIIASGGEDPAPGNNHQANNTNNNNGSPSSTNGPSKAEKGWKELQETIASAEKSRNYEKILATIRRIEPAIRGSQYQVQAARLKTEYRRKKREVEESRAAEEAFAKVKREIAADTDYLRYNEIVKTLMDALRKAPGGSMVSAEIAKAKSEYTSKYEGVATRKYNEIIQRVNIHIDSEEYKPAIKIIDYFFPPVYRHSNIWKTSLKPLYERCIEKSKKS